MNYEDVCDLCESESIHISDYGYCLCYPCYLKNPNIQKEINRLEEKENFLLG